MQNSKFAPKSEQECEQLREKNENQRSDDQPSSLLVQSGDNSGVSSVNWSAEPSHAVDRRTPQSRENQQQQHSPHTCPRGIPEPFQNFMHGCGRLDPDSPEPLARHGTVCAQIRPCGTGRRPTLARPFVETDVPATSSNSLSRSTIIPPAGDLTPARKLEMCSINRSSSCSSVGTVGHGGEEGALEIYWVSDF